MPSQSHIAMDGQQRAAKLQKVEAFRRKCPHVTSAGLAAILQEVAASGAPELTQPKHMREAREHRISQCNAYGPLIDNIEVVLEDGSARSVPIVNLFSLLQSLYEQEGAYHHLLKKTCHEHQCSLDHPLQLLYYNDEVVCGNPLANETTRKLQLCYISFGQFGGHVLSQEQSWLVIFCMRSSEVSSIKGGMSQITAGILKHILYHPQCSIKQTGLLLKSKSGGYLRVFMKMGFMIQDGLAQKSIWSLKGFSATRYCMFCVNLVAGKACLEDEELLTCSSWDISNIVLSTKEELQGVLSRLQANSLSMSKADFKLYEQAVGFNYCEYALPWDQALSGDIDPLKCFVHDFMHAFFVKGVFNTTTYQLLCSLDDFKNLDIYNTLCNWLSTWRLPRREDMSKLFTPKRKEANKKAGTFKCTAGEGLSLCPLLAVFLALTIIPANACLPQQIYWTCWCPSPMGL